MVLEISQNSEEHTCARVSFLIKLQASTCSIIKKETTAQVFSCEFCEIFNNSFFLQNISNGCFWNLFMLKLLEDFAKFFKNNFFTEHLWTIASELLHVDFNLVDRNEKNIFFTKSCYTNIQMLQDKENWEAYQQLMYELK